ncbi:MAG: helix-turn-helix transcriptional regulator [Rhizobacter sp.]|nr:helix-turn-helix transcriptional regulator [Ferruginibacter sp.]
MFFEFGPKSSTLLIFFFHGIVFSILLFYKAFSNNSKSGYWLSLFTFLCALYLCPFMLGYGAWYSKQPYRDIMFYIPFQQLFLLPPVLYFYIRSLLDKSFIFSKKDWLHFLPAICYFLYCLIVFVTDKIILKQYYFYLDGKDKDLSTWYQLAGFLSFIGYLLASLDIYKKYKKISYDELSFADSVMFKWASRFLTAMLLLLLIRGLLFLLNPEWGEFGKKYWYYGCFSVLVYYVSISGYVNSVSSMTSLKTLTLAGTNLDNTDITVEKAEEIPAGETGQHTGAVDKQLPDLLVWKEKIEQVMEQQKLYEDPELTLSQLCNTLGIHSKKGSQIINQGFGINFNDFVNLYRTKAVIKKMEAGEHSLQTLLGIAYECGFNSKSTFNRAFKRHITISPQAYIEKYREQIGVKS